MSASRSIVLGILANLSGVRREPGLEQRRFLEVDRDTLDAAIRRLEPEIEVGLPFCRTLRFSSWGDFHPDAIAGRVPALRKLLDARSEVASPAAMRRLLEEAGVSADLAEAEPEGPPPPPTEPAPPPATQADEGSILDSMISGVESRPRAPVRSRLADPQLEELIRGIADASADPEDHAQQQRWRAAIDHELGTRMRAILHHPAFRNLEGSWGSVRWLVREAETGEGLRIRLLNLSHQEILGDAAPADQLSATQLYRLIYEEGAGTPGAEQPAFLLADLEFSDGQGDLRALSHLGAIAALAEAPLLAAASSSLCDTETRPSQAWQELRESTAGRWLGLCYPRVLLRLPYGPETSPLESFEFDECTDPEGDPPCSWGSPALAVGIVMARAVGATGTVEALPRFAHLDGLPLHVFRAQGEVRHLGPTEQLLTESRLEQLVERGIIPLAGFAGQDAAQLIAFRSISGDSFLGR